MAEQLSESRAGAGVPPDADRRDVSSRGATSEPSKAVPSEAGIPVGTTAGSGVSAAFSLCYREIIRFLRQRNRIVGAVGQPVLFWLLFGAGLGPSFQLGEGMDVSYREYFFPGTLALILLFTAIFSTISIIEDRREGFLQSVLVAPIPRWAMVLGKVAGGTVLAVGQALLFLALGWAWGLNFTLIGVVSAALFSCVVAFALTSLGFVIAWRMDSTQGFHAIMSVFLLPMWLLSGAFFPADRGWLSWVMWSNPLTYGVAGLRRLLYLGSSSDAAADWMQALPALPAALGVTVLFAVVAFVASCWIAGQRTTGDLL